MPKTCKNIPALAAEGMRLIELHLPCCGEGQAHSHFRTLAVFPIQRKRRSFAPLRLTLFLLRTTDAEH